MRREAKGLPWLTRTAHCPAVPPTERGLARIHSNRDRTMIVKPHHPEGLDPWDRYLMTPSPARWPMAPDRNITPGYGFLSEVPSGSSVMIAPLAIGFQIIILARLGGDLRVSLPFSYVVEKIDR